MFCDVIFLFLGFVERSLFLVAITKFNHTNYIIVVLTINFSYAVVQLILVWETCFDPTVPFMKYWVNKSVVMWDF